MLLAVQLSLIQSLSFVQGHHLAYVILSVALLGFGAGGSLLTIFRNTPLAKLDRWYAPFASLAGVSVAWLPRAVYGFLRDIEVDLLFTGVEPWLQLAVVGTLLCIPFCAGALALSIVFRTKSHAIGVIYAANLVGSSVGALLVIPLLTGMLPEHLLPLLGLLGILAGGLYRARHLWWHLLCGVLVVAAIATREPWAPSQYRDLAYALQLPAHEASGPYPHYHGRLDRVQAPALRYAPDVSLQYRGSVPSPPHYFVNGNRSAVIVDPVSADSSILAHTPQGLPYALQSYRSVLFLGPEGNAPVLLAAADENTVIDVVVSHPLIARRLDSALPSTASLHRADARSFLAVPRATDYDLIVFPMRGLFGGPTGLQTLGGDTLFTVEAISRALELLAEPGWMAFPVWLDDPLRHSLRVLALIRKGLAVHGISHFEDHVIMLRGWGSVYFMVSNTVVDQEHIARAFAFAGKHGFDVIHPYAEDATMRHGALQAPPALWFRHLIGAEAAAFLADYRFDIRAPTDARPFFDQFIRPGDWGADLDWLSVSERGLTVLYVLLVQLAVAVLLIVFLPLLPLRKQLAAGSGTIGYFTGLGAGFMLYEVALIQLLIPLWGDPVTGAAFVIATLLVGMSLGSLLVTRLPVWFRDVRVLATGACVLLLGIGMGIPYIIQCVLPLGPALRFWILGPVLVLSAIILGMPFPGGIRFLHRTAEQQIPWACGIDGGVAVMAAPAGALLAFYFGYPMVVMLAAGAYGVSILSAHWGWRRGQRETR